MLRIYRKIALSSLAIIMSFTAQAKNEYFKFMNTTIMVADSTTAAKEISKPDSYTDHFSPFDYQSKVGGTGQYGVSDYLEKAAKEVRDWTPGQALDLKEGFSKIATVIKEKSLLFPLPDTVIMIKTNGQEEYGAEGYTRRNMIMLNAQDRAVELSLIAHELFHVFSRANPEVRDRIYANFGFKKCKPIDISAALHGRNISNPDCPVIEHYITVGDEDLIIVLYSKKDYTGGNVFASYVAVDLMAVSGDGQDKQPVMQEGEPVLYSFQEKMDIFKQVGTNTGYLLHVEELSAEHFVFLITGEEPRQPKYVMEMRKTLKK